MGHHKNLNFLDNVPFFGLHWTKRRLIYIYWQESMGSIKLLAGEAGKLSDFFIGISLFNGAQILC